MTDRYMLNSEGQPEEMADLDLWGECFKNSRHVARTDINGVDVSTVFLPINHNFGGSGPPVLWETMIFGGSEDQYQERYTSRADAVIGHIDALDIVYKSMDHIIMDKVLLSESAPDDSISTLKNGDKFIDAFNVYIVSEGSLENPDVIPKMQLEAVCAERGDDDSDHPGKIVGVSLSVAFESVEDLEAQVDHSRILNWNELVTALIKAIKWPT